MDKMTEHGATSIEQIKLLSTYPQFNQPHSFTHLLKEEATIASLIKFFEQAKDGKVEEFFKSQKPPNYRKYSLKLCGKTFQKEILDFEETCVYHYISSIGRLSLLKELSCMQDLWG